MKFGSGQTVPLPSSAASLYVTATDREAGASSESFSVVLLLCFSKIKCRIPIYEWWLSEYRIDSRTFHSFA